MHGSTQSQPQNGDQWRLRQPNVTYESDTDQGEVDSDTGSEFSTIDGDETEALEVFHLPQTHDEDEDQLPQQDFHGVDIDHLLSRRQTIIDDDMILNSAGGFGRVDIDIDALIDPEIDAVRERFMTLESATDVNEVHEGGVDIGTNLNLPHITRGEFEARRPFQPAMNQAEIDGLDTRRAILGLHQTARLIFPPSSHILKKTF